MAERVEFTSDEVASFAGRLNPMGMDEFVAYVSTPEGFRQAKAAIASAMGQARSRKKLFGFIG